MRSEKILPFQLELICSVLFVVQQQNQNNMKEMKRNRRTYGKRENEKV